MAATWPDGQHPGAKLGDSVAINGTCLTVVALAGDAKRVLLDFDASHETLRLTSLGKLSVGARCNLERAVRPSDRLGGHLVTGHVDCTGKLLSAVRKGDCWDLTYSLPDTIAAEVAQKGSIAIDGVSLTVNGVQNGRFTVTVIPHTVTSTPPLDGKRDKAVNLESDLLAKYVRRLLLFQSVGRIDAKTLADAGFPV